jgi:ElaB/YqjD/DUF883 family membrane-anchored ribosome-binding protein
MTMDLNQLDREQLANLEEKLKKAKDKIETLVKENPLTSVVVALSVGYLLARLINRKNK